MSISTWLRFVGPVSPAQRSQIAALVRDAGVDGLDDPPAPSGLGIAVLARADAQSLDEVRALSRHATVLAICLAPEPMAPAAMWAVLDAGAADLLRWPTLPQGAHEVTCRLQRWHTVATLADSTPVREAVAGHSPAWRALLRNVVELAHFTEGPVLITGETGTGKEQVARLVHALDARAGLGEFVILDCTTVSPELSGSEFFGHERGAFTGATGPRDGAFALAHRGTLFLDEVGELSLPLQAQLLRVVQERQYKRLGSNAWQRSEFRLVCATHRDLEAAVAAGQFRADLYHRIAALRCTLPPLRERRDDILPLARFFLAQLDARAEGLAMDDAVRDYLLSRPYPGNVRELRQTVARLWHRHGGGGVLTVGNVPPHERPTGAIDSPAWPDPGFAGAIRRAVELGIALKEIGDTAAQLAKEAAFELEDQDPQRAARRLGVTPRTMQYWLAERRVSH
ncbi:sigma 54-interacting transcriptional regulator [Ideonella sp. A 288]|uniref:sigma 54-interacting transcriptional regulator n=1 Tax=Ideonella sp. A 288 TaxID=1962181 RepID=UPI000B4B9D4B|nr:sigma 54-interacting transcriptional regulator [Ideonella sp. A 288]